MIIERWLTEQLDIVTAIGPSKAAMADFLRNALTKAREQKIPADEMTVFVTNALFKSSIKMIQDVWIERGCRYAELVFRIRDQIGNEQTVELHV